GHRRLRHPDRLRGSARRRRRPGGGAAPRARGAPPGAQRGGRLHLRGRGRYLRRAAGAYGDSRVGGARGGKGHRARGGKRAGGCLLARPPPARARRPPHPGAGPLLRYRGGRGGVGNDGPRGGLQPGGVGADGRDAPGRAGHGGRHPVRPGALRAGARARRRAGRREEGAHGGGRGGNPGRAVGRAGARGGDNGGVHLPVRAGEHLVAQADGGGGGGADSPGALHRGQPGVPVLWRNPGRPRGLRAGAEEVRDESSRRPQI
ncbi:MAG: hypothetical protein AVDCRST_MAG02-1749, partial [uncultured Rubrobacteraceae bacterium]